MAIRITTENPYGIDFGCNASGLDMRKNFSMTFGKDNVLNALISRMVDKLWYAPRYGINVAQRVRASQPANYPKLASEIETELSKDDRVTAIRVNIAKSSNSTVTITVTGRLVTAEEFSLIGSVSLLSNDPATFST